jgi:hypothetical protein
MAFSRRFGQTCHQRCLTALHHFCTRNEVMCNLKQSCGGALQGMDDREAVETGAAARLPATLGQPRLTRDMTAWQRQRLVLLTGRSGVLANLHVASAAAACIP